VRREPLDLIHCAKYAYIYIYVSLKLSKIPFGSDIKYGFVRKIPTSRGFSFISVKRKSVSLHLKQLPSFFAQQIFLFVQFKLKYLHLSTIQYYIMIKYCEVDKFRATCINSILGSKYVSNYIMNVLCRYFSSSDFCWREVNIEVSMAQKCADYQIWASLLLREVALL
jgi:hypothetical protein